MCAEAKRHKQLLFLVLLWRHVEGDEGSFEVGVQCTLLEPCFQVHDTVEYAPI